MAADENKTAGIVASNANHRASRDAPIADGGAVRSRVEVVNQGSRLPAPARLEVGRIAVNLVRRRAALQLGQVSAFPAVQQRDPFRAAAMAFVPALTTAEPETWQALENTVGDALAARPAGIVRRLGLFLRILDVLAFVRTGRTLRRARPDRIARLLHRLERSPVLLIRRGIWGLRTLVFMGYYTQPAIMRSIGYRAEPAGWAARNLQVPTDRQDRPAP
jgi:hypothetical protein